MRLRTGHFINVQTCMVFIVLSFYSPIDNPISLFPYFPLLPTPPAYGLNNTLPIVFLPSKSLWAVCTSSNAYVPCTNTSTFPCSINANSSVAYRSNSGRVAM